MKASVFVGTSVDGFIARSDGDVDWLHAAAAGEQPDLGYDAFMSSVDVVVMGRHTFEKVLTFKTWPYARPVVVLSSRELAPTPDGAVVERMSGSPTDVVAKVSARGFEHEYVDGGNTIQRFLNAGLVQRLIITRVPVLIGSGIPLFGETLRDIRLRHAATRAFEGGETQTEYEVVF